MNETSETPSTIKEDSNPSIIESLEALSIVDPSSKNSFYLELNPVRNLKLAIAALSDFEFNENGTASIQVGPTEFTLTVSTGTDTDNVFVGRLCLKPSGFIKFDVHKPLVGKKIDLDEISEHLYSVPDEDTVTIFHVLDSDHLSFILPAVPGSTDVTKFDVDLHESDLESKPYPNLLCGSSCLSRDDLWRILHHHQKNEEKILKGCYDYPFVMLDSNADLSVAPRGLEFACRDQRESEEGRVHHVFFKWPYYESLKKASRLTKEVSLCLFAEPSESVIWQFNLEGLGALGFLTKATKYYSDPDCELLNVSSTALVLVESSSSTTSVPQSTSCCLRKLQREKEVDFGTEGVLNNICSNLHQHVCVSGIL